MNHCWGPSQPGSGCVQSRPADRTPSLPGSGYAPCAAFARSPAPNAPPQIALHIYNGEIKKKMNLKGSSYEIDLAFIKLVLYHGRTIIHVHCTVPRDLPSKKAIGLSTFCGIILQTEYHMVVN